jgi:hypothetical protein
MSLGKASLLRLATCHPELRRFVQQLANDVDEGLVEGVSDLTVLWGYRGEAAQNEAFKRGTSKLQYPQSKHNKVPALAVDIAPYPIPRTPSGEWDDKSPQWEALRAYALKLAARMHIRIRVISWDLPHYELVSA